MENHPLESYLPSLAQFLQRHGWRRAGVESCIRFRVLGQFSGRSLDRLGGGSKFDEERTSESEKVD